MKEIVIISDFDGTIVEEQVDFILFEKFGSSVWKEFENMRITGILSYEDAMTGSVMSINATLKELNSFALSHMTARDGVEKFKIFCDEHDIPFFIASAGLDFYIKLFLEKMKWKNVETYSPSITYNGHNYSIRFPSIPFSKANFVETLKNKFSGKTIVFIGDGSLDIDAALCSDITFARRKLSEMMQERKLPFYSFETFHEVKDKIMEIVN